MSAPTSVANVWNSVIGSALTASIGCLPYLPRNAIVVQMAFTGDPLLASTSA
jgi:hypothetical protein